MKILKYIILVIIGFIISIENCNANSYDLSTCKFPNSGNSTSVDIIICMDKYGLYDNQNKKFIKEPTYDNIYSSYLYPINKNKKSEQVNIIELNKKFGLLKKNGESILPPIYEDLDSGNLHSGRLIVKINGKYGILNEINNTYIINPEYDEIKIIKKDPYFHKTKIYRLKKDGLYGISDMDGNILYPPVYDEIKYLGTNYLTVKKNDKYGIFNIEKKEMSEIIFDKISYTKMSNVKVEKDGKEYLLYPWQSRLKTVGIVAAFPFMLVGGILCIPLALVAFFSLFY